MVRIPAEHGKRNGNRQRSRQKWNMQAGYFQQEETEEDTLFLCPAAMGKTRFREHIKKKVREKR